MLVFTADSRGAELTLRLTLSLQSANLPEVHTPNPVSGREHVITGAAAPVGRRVHLQAMPYSMCAALFKTLSYLQAIFQTVSCVNGYSTVGPRAPPSLSSSDV